MNTKQIKDFFDTCDDGYYDSGTRYFEVNVKRYNDYVNVEELIAEYPIQYKKRLEEHFTDSHIEAMYTNWLQYEAEYLINDCIKNKCMNTSKKWWIDNVQVKIEAGESTGYPYLDDIPKKEDKLAELSKWIQKDEEEIAMFNIVKDIYQLGRMGGHICFTVNGEYDEEDTEASEVLMNRIIALKNFISTANKNLNFKDEIKFRIEEEIEEYKTEDAEDARIQKEAEANTTDTMNSKLSELLLSKNEQVKRLAKGIYKVIQK